MKVRCECGKYMKRVAKTDIDELFKCRCKRMKQIRYNRVIHEWREGN